MKVSLMTKVALAKNLLVGLSLVTLLAACGAGPSFNGTQYDPPRPAPPLPGTNWDGTEFAIEDLTGTVSLVFFGFTFCPDICPLTLGKMRQIYEALPEEQANLAVVFVSVDPERDTPARLEEYVPAFHPDFYGLHISAADLEEVKRGYGVYAEKSVPEAGASAVDYLVDHTGWIYLIDKAGNLRLTYSHSTPVEEIISDVEQLLAERG